MSINVCHEHEESTILLIGGNVGECSEWLIKNRKIDGYTWVYDETDTEIFEGQDAHWFMTVKNISFDPRRVLVNYVSIDEYKFKPGQTFRLAWGATTDPLDPENDESLSYKVGFVDDYGLVLVEPFPDSPDSRTELPYKADLSKFQWVGLPVDYPKD